MQQDTFLCVFAVLFRPNEMFMFIKHLAQIDMLSSRFGLKKMCHSSNNRKKEELTNTKC